MFSEKQPFCGEPGQEESFADRSEIPLGIQALAQACAASGLTEEFEQLLQQNVGRDFKDIYSGVVLMMQEQSGMTKDVVEKGLREVYDVYLHEDEPVGPDHRLWYD